MRHRNLSSGLDVNVVGLADSGSVPDTPRRVQSPIRSYLETHRATIIAGFVLWAVFYALWDLTF